MDTFKDFLLQIENPEQEKRTREVLRHIRENFPQLDRRIAWGNPTFTHQGTFIIAFSLAKAHLAVAPEAKAVKMFAEEIKLAGYASTKMMFKLPWDKPVDYALLERIIRYNIKDKEGLASYWRPKEDW